MKRAAAAAVTLILTGACGATGALARVVPGSYAVTGSARNAYPTPAGPGYSILTISAHAGLSGQKAGGLVTANGTTGVTMGEFAVSGAVTCLRVSGNRASIKYRFDQASGSAAQFKAGGVEVFVEDNGKPQTGQPVDAAAFDPPQPAGVFDAAAARCDDPATAAYNRVESGDYTISRRATVTVPGNRRGKGRHRGGRPHRPAAPPRFTG